MTGYVVEVQGDGEGLTWADGETLSRCAVPSAFGKFLAQARAEIEDAPAEGAERPECPE